MSDRKERRPRPKLKAKGLARHWDGWQAGALVLMLASSAVFLAVPRAVEPVDLPQPLVDRRALAATMAQDDALAAQAVEQELDVDIRAVGRELRAYNSAAARGDQQALAQARPRVVRATARALHRSESELVILRAYQTQRFIIELGRWQQTGQASAELAELGGDFLRLASRNRWCTGQGRQLVAEEAVLRAFFKKRWNDLTGANAGVFLLTVDEDRVRYGFLLNHPLLPRDRPETPSWLTQQRWQAIRIRQQFEIIEHLGARDPSYPAQLARGMLLYQTRKYGAATDAFRLHLEAAPTGPYALRAQNYLKAALEQTRQGLF